MGILLIRNRISYWTLMDQEGRVWTDGISLKTYNTGFFAYRARTLILMMKDESGAHYNHTTSTL
jgi:hypothetical protein